MSNEWLEDIKDYYDRNKYWLIFTPVLLLPLGWGGAIAYKLFATDQIGTGDEFGYYYSFSADQKHSGTVSGRIFVFDSGADPARHQSGAGYRSNLVYTVACLELGSVQCSTSDFAKSPDENTYSDFYDESYSLALSCSDGGPRKLDVSADNTNIDVSITGAALAELTADGEEVVTDLDLSWFRYFNGVAACDFQLGEQA